MTKNKRRTLLAVFLFTLDTTALTTLLDTDSIMPSSYAGDLALIHVVAYMAIRYVGKIGFMGSLLHGLKSLIRFLKEPAGLARSAPPQGRGPSDQSVLLSVLLQSLFILLEVLEHLLVHASLELLSSLGTGQLARDTGLVFQLEIQLLRYYIELRARRQSRKLRS